MIAENLGNILVGGLLIAAIAAVIFKMVKDRKKGKNSCGCGCSTCSMNGACHKG